MLEWKKEYLLLAVALACLVIYYYRNSLKDYPTTNYLPVVGGLAFGFNTLINLVK